MSGTYTVTSNLLLRSNAQQVLQQVSRALLGLHTRLGNVQTRLNAVSAALTTMGNNVTGIRAATAAMSALQSSTASASAAVQGATRAMATNAAAMGRAAAAAQQAAAAMRQVAAVPPIQRVPNPARGGAGGGGAYHSRLGEMAGLSAMSGSGQRGVGAVMTDAGAFQQAGTMIRAQGFTQAESDATMAAASRLVRQVPGVTLTDAVNAIAEARTTVGSVENAIAIAPNILRASRVSGVLTGQDNEAAVRPLVRALGLRGAFTSPTGELDAARGTAELEAMMRTIIAFRGAFQPRELLNFMQQAGVAGKDISIEGLSGPMASLIQETGGHRAGTMLTAFRRQAVAGTMTRAQAAEWRRLGLIAPDARLADVSNEQIMAMVRRGELSEDEATTLRAESGTGGGIVQAPVVGRDLARTRPDLWMQQIFTEIMARHGVTTEAALVDAVGRLFGTAVGQRFGTQMLQTREVREDVEAVRRVAPNAADVILNEGFTNNVAGVVAAFHNMLTQLGAATAQNLIPWMRSFADGLLGIGEWFQRNPELATALVVTAAGMTALATAGALFATGALAVSGLVGLATAIGAGGAGLATAAIAIAPYTPVLLAVAGGLTAIYAAISGNTWQEKLATVRGTLEGFNSVLSESADAFGRFLSRIRSLLTGGTGAGAAPGATAPGATTDTRPSLGNPSGDFIPQSFNPRPPAAGGEGMTPVVLMLDGREVGRGMAPHLGREANGPVQSAARYDTRAAFIG